MIFQLVTLYKLTLILPQYQFYCLLKYLFLVSRMSGPSETGQSDRSIYGAARLTGGLPVSPTRSASAPSSSGPIFE